MPAPRFRHGFANDVFISYTHVDNDEEAGLRWVSQFEQELKARLANVSGQSIETWPKPTNDATPPMFMNNPRWPHNSLEPVNAQASTPNSQGAPYAASR